MCRLLFTLLAVFTVLSASANGPKRSIDHKQDFPIGRPTSLFTKGLSDNQKWSFMELLVKNGGTLENSFFKKYFVPSISFRQAKEIHGARGENALRIEVSTQRIKVYYTTPASLERAISLVEQSVIERRGVPVIQGIDMIDWSDHADAATAVKHRAGELDLTGRDPLLSRHQIENIIEKQTPKSELDLILVSSKGWVAQSATLDKLSAQKIYAPTGMYSQSQIASIFKYAASSGIKLVPRLEILRPIPNFEQALGHNQFSVEGMRFIRAIVQEWCKQWGCTQLSVGKPSPQADARYMDFIQTLGKRLNVEIIVE